MVNAEVFGFLLVGFFRFNVDSEVHMVEFLIFGSCLGRL